MNHGDAVLAAVLSLREATEQSFNRVEGEMARRFDAAEMRTRTLETRFDALETRFGALETRFGALETRLDRFEVKILHRFDTLEGRLITVERR